MKMPYPDVPRYVPGGYGRWDLVKMPALRQYGYFTGPQVEPPYYMLVREGQVWMTTSRMERESHSFHLSVARGRAMVCGVGMGLYLHNLCAMDHVHEIVAVDIDAEVIDILRVATDFESWRGREKVRFVCYDARELTSEQIGSEPFDHLYVDIWPELGSEQAVGDTREIQSRVLAKSVGYWGQEIDFGKWHAQRRGNGRPSALEGREFARRCRLPLGPLNPIYLRACCAATQVYAAKVAEDDGQMPPILAKSSDEMRDNAPRRSAG